MAGKWILLIVAVVAVAAAALGAGITTLVTSDGDKIPAGYSFRSYGQSDFQQAVRTLGLECIRQSHALGDEDGLHCYRLSGFPGSYQIFLSDRRVEVLRGNKTVFSATQPK